MTSSLGTISCHNMTMFAMRTSTLRDGTGESFGDTALCKRFHSQMKGIQNPAKSIVKSLFHRLLQLTSDAQLATSPQTPSSFWRE